MKYDKVQQSLEQFIVDNWSATDVQYDNTSFNSDMYIEYLRCHVAFGEGMPRSVTKGCWRQTGILFLTVFTKPAEGSNRKLELAAAAALLVTATVVYPVSPLVAPAVSLKTPSLFNDNREQDGWVQAVVSCPFYYDLTT